VDSGFRKLRESDRTFLTLCKSLFLPSLFQLSTLLRNPFVQKSCPPLQDTLASLRPKLIRLPRLEVVLQAVAQQEAQEAAIAEEEAARGEGLGASDKKPKGRKKTIASRIADGSVNIVEGETKPEWGEGEESESDDGSGSERGGDKEDRNEGKAASDTEEEGGMEHGGGGGNGGGGR
jgi:hypothetical protein